jgi:hypothetical protein
LNNVTAAAVHFPRSLDKGPLERVRRPLAVLAALLLVVDFIGLGLHLADTDTSPFASDTPAGVKARIDAPEAVVPGSVLGDRLSASDRSRSAEPLGCLSASSGCYNPPPAAPGASSPAPPTTPPTTPGTKPVPLVQANVGVPALGAQVSLGVGDGGCTGLALTVIDIGGCSIVSSEDPVVLDLGGLLLGD